MLLLSGRGGGGWFYRNDRVLREVGLRLRATDRRALLKGVLMTTGKMASWFLGESRVNFY